MLARLIAPLALVAVAALPARAQDSAARPIHLTDTTEHPGKWLFGAGANVSGASGEISALQLGREWRAADSRFGLRLEAGLIGRTERSSLLTGPSYEIYGTSSESYRDFSLSLLTTFALTKGRVQPYLISGFMMQRRTTRIDDTIFPADPTRGEARYVAGDYSYRYTQSRNGVVGGFGLQARVGGVWVYTETKSHMVSSDDGWRMARPFTLGLRF